MPNRTYTCKDVEMLLASETIVKSFRANLAELSLARTNWTELFATDLETRISAATDRYLGLDKKAEQRKATTLLHSLKVPAERALSFLKTQIEVDFKGQENEVLTSLGYSANWQAVQNNDQEGLIQLLYAFKKGMTEDLKAQFVANGTNPTLIDNIVAYASELEAANVNQESLKLSSKQLTSAAAAELNAIYESVIGICKIASKYFESTPTLAEQFTFSRVVATMNNPVNKTDDIAD